MYVKIQIIHCSSSLRSKLRSNWLKMQLDRLELSKNPGNYAHGSYGTKQFMLSKMSMNSCWP